MLMSKQAGHGLQFKKNQFLMNTLYTIAALPTYIFSEEGADTNTRRVFSHCWNSKQK